LKCRAVLCRDQGLALIHQELDYMGRNLEDRAQFLHHDLHFHLYIGKACGNRVLKRMMSVVLEALFSHMRRIAENYSDLDNILRLHENTYQAFRRHDQRQARSAMIEHMRVSRKENRRWSPEVPLRLEEQSESCTANSLKAHLTSPDERV
jgi:DNA-binding FadR family transcriptional regulator